jgi:hypothetical protein
LEVLNKRTNMQNKSPYRLNNPCNEISNVD